MEIIRFHLNSRQGAGNGGCQERSLVMNGRLLLSNLNVRHFTSLNSFMGFLFLVTISVCGISSTNQSLNLSFFSAFLANFVIRLVLLLCSVLIFVCFNACSKDMYSSWRIICKPVFKHLSSMLLSVAVIMGPQNGTPTSQIDMICCCNTSTSSVFGHPRDFNLLIIHILLKALLQMYSVFEIVFRFWVGSGQRV